MYNFENLMEMNKQLLNDSLMELESFCNSANKEEPN